MVRGPEAGGSGSATRTASSADDLQLSDCIRWLMNSGSAPACLPGAKSQPASLLPYGIHPPLKFPRVCSESSPVPMEPAHITFVIGTNRAITKQPVVSPRPSARLSKAPSCSERASHVPGSERGSPSWPVTPLMHAQQADQVTAGIPDQDTHCITRRIVGLADSSPCHHPPLANWGMGHRKVQHRCRDVTTSVSLARPNHQV